MILFVAPNPNKAKNHEGFMQRVAAIDNVFKDYDRRYSEDYDDSELAKLIIEADIIYVHSMYNAEKIATCYELYGHKIITDLHGVVPEEEEYADNQEGFRVMSSVESTALKHGKYFVSVTHAMTKHFHTKYPDSKRAKWIVLPIHGEYDVHNNDSLKNPHQIIYAGGGQPWQNTNLMVDAVNSLPSYEFTILTHDPGAFIGIEHKKNSNVRILSVKAGHVAEYYKTASMGFILRTDTTVNNVACPTKLIEYLACGVVPVVSSENIGDFKRFGYRYLTIENLKTSPSRNFLTSAREENFKVYRKIKKTSADGIRQLLKAGSNIVSSRTDEGNNPSEGHIVQALELQRMKSKILRQEYQIEVYTRMVGEYAAIVDSQSRELQSRIAKDAISRIRALQRLVRRRK